ncbi:MAG TPA: hypothetical protein VKA48_08820, partial [Gammaproteobacteria bacterium]|nr:hypothetical protein [Gammaproteobacteria bacterium]
DGGDAGDFMQAESVSQLTMQEQLLNASNDLYSALARATLKNVTASEAGGFLSSALGGGEGLGKLGGKLLASGSSAAETRNWLTLPYAIRVVRVPVQPGKHHLEVNTFTQNGSRMAHAERTVELDPGEVRVWVRRTMDPTQQRPNRPAGMKTASN